MNSLQQLITRCYQLNRDSISVPQKMLAGLEKNILTLSDLHIQHHEVDPLCKFLTSRNAMNSLEVLILNKSSAKTKRLRRQAASKAGAYSALNLFGGKLLKAVNCFLAKSQAVRFLEIDSVTLSIPLLQALGTAMSTRQEHIALGFQQVIFRNVSLGGDGLRALSPHLGKCLIQSLTLESCNLGDDSLPYLSSVVKAHEAIQAECYWNSTLRIYPERNSHAQQQQQQQQQQPQQRLHQLQHVYSDGVTNTGLLVLNLSRNKYTSVGSKCICKLIHTNQWILGINLSNNCIEEEGITKIMECSIPSPETSSLLCLHLRGNPGCSTEILEELSERALQSMVNPVLASLPGHCARSLIKWLRLQEDATPPQPSRPSKISRKSTQGSREHGNGFLEPSSVLGAQDVISLATDTSRSLRLGELQQAETFSSHEYEEVQYVPNVDIVCDEELPSGQNYLQDSSVEGFLPPSPGKGIDGRPPSRNSIRPRYDGVEHADSHDRETRTSSQSAPFDTPRDGYLGSSQSSRPTSARSSRTRSTGPPVNNSALHRNRNHSNMDKRPVSARSASAPVGRGTGRGADRYTNPYDIAITSRTRTRTGGGPPPRRRSTRSSLDMLSASSATAKNTHASKKPPFRPTSASARIHSYEQNTQAHTSYLNSGERDTFKSHDFLRRSHSVTEPAIRGRGRQVASSSLSTRSRRRQSSIDLTRARQQRKRRSNNTRRNSSNVIGQNQTQRQTQREGQGQGLGYEEEGLAGRQRPQNAEMLVEEMGKSVMLELSKVVNSVSSELQNVSTQMQSLTESMSESVSMINMSRDMTFTTQNDAPRGNQHEFFHDTVIMEDGTEDMNGHVELSDLNREKLEYLRLQQENDDDINLSLLIEDGLRSKLVDIIENVMQSEA